MNDDIRAARCYLLAVAEPPAPALIDFIAQHGPIEAALLVRNGEVPSTVAVETKARRSRINPDQLRQAGGARLIIPEDDEWPSWPLHSLSIAAGRGVGGLAAPIALWACGSARLAELTDRSVTMVGSRACSSYGEFIAADWAHSLAGAGVRVFSGAAYGIDAAAHRGVLAAEGSTVAILGCATDSGYPAGHDALIRKVTERGLVLSEYPPGTPPARHRFLVRNRLLAALSCGTLVIEADLRSGARNTAGTAEALGKPVLAVPGPITARTSAGCHDMIRSHQASLVTSPAQVLEAIGRCGIDLNKEETAGRSRPTDALSGPALRVFEALRPMAGKSAEQIAEESGVPVLRVRALLPALELDNFSERCEAGWRLAPATRSREP